MRTRIATSLAALVAASFAALASAQAPAGATAYVDEPVASLASGTPTNERANAIIQALNAEAALKGSKLTVAPDGDDLVYLTGVTVTREQMQRAMQIAGSQAGEGKVANAMTSEQLVVASNVPPPAIASEGAPATPEMGALAPATSEAILPATPDGGETILAATPRT